MIREFHRGLIARYPTLYPLYRQGHDFCANFECVRSSFLPSKAPLQNRVPSTSRAIYQLFMKAIPVPPVLLEGHFREFHSITTVHLLTMYRKSILNLLYVSSMQKTILTAQLFPNDYHIRALYRRKNDMQTLKCLLSLRIIYQLLFTTTSNQLEKHTIIFRAYLEKYYIRQKMDVLLLRNSSTANFHLNFTSLIQLLLCVLCMFFAVLGTSCER